MNITVYIKDVYGVRTVYPHCDKAKLFASLCGTKTLTINALSDIEKLGYSIAVRQDQPTTLSFLKGNTLCSQ